MRIVGCGIGHAVALGYLVSGVHWSGSGVISAIVASWLKPQWHSPYHCRWWSNPAVIVMNITVGFFSDPIVLCLLSLLGRLPGSYRPPYHRWLISVGMDSGSNWGFRPNSDYQIWRSVCCLFHLWTYASTLDYDYLQLISTTCTQANMFWSSAFICSFFEYMNLW
jgi:hypothetical protein